MATLSFFDDDITINYKFNEVAMNYLSDILREAQVAVDSLATEINFKNYIL